MNMRYAFVFRILPPCGFKPHKKRDPAVVKPGGLGLYFIQKVMDKVEFLKPQDGKGNVLELVKKIGRKS